MEIILKAKHQFQTNDENESKLQERFNHKLLEVILYLEDKENT